MISKLVVLSLSFLPMVASADCNPIPERTSEVEIIASLSLSLRCSEEGKEKEITVSGYCQITYKNEEGVEQRAIMKSDSCPQVPQGGKAKLHLKHVCCDTPVRVSCLHKEKIAKSEKPEHFSCFAGSRWIASNFEPTLSQNTKSAPTK